MAITKKPVAKKTTTAKPAVKKTTSTTSKPAVKKTTTTKVDVLSALKKKYDAVFDDKTVYTVRLNGKYGFVDRVGKVLISPCFTALGDEFVNGAIIVWGEQGIGFVSDKGKVIAKPKYSSGRDFNNGYAAVCKNKKWGLIDKTGKEVVSLKYDEVGDYKCSKIKVKLNGKEFYVDATGKPITSAAKPAVKKTTKTVATTTDISVTGNKKIDTLRKEFNKKFPYLRLGIFYSYARQQVAKGEAITPIDGSKTLASVRRANSGGDISISGNKKIKSLEKEFDTVFGLYCQVCFTDGDGHRYYTSGSNDEKTLSSFNTECEKRGCAKGVWK